MPSPKTIIVTGANRGIGRAICNLLLQDPRLPSLKLYATSRSGENLALLPPDQQQQPSDGQPQRQVLYPKLDISVKESVAAFAARVRSEAGEGVDRGVVDVLINNAGVNLDRPHTAENVKRTVEVNYWGTLEMCETFTPLLAPSGRIVNISSIASQLKPYSGSIATRFRNPSASLADSHALAAEYLAAETSTPPTTETAGFGPPGRPYNISKALVNMLTAMYGRDERLVGKGVAVNCCCPGWVATDMGKLVGSRPPKSEEEGARIPVRLALGDLGGVTGRYWANDGVRSREEGKVQEW